MSVHTNVVLVPQAGGDFIRQVQGEDSVGDVLPQCPKVPLVLEAMSVIRMRVRPRTYTKAHVPIRLSILTAKLAKHIAPRPLIGRPLQRPRLHPRIKQIRAHRWRRTHVPKVEQEDATANPRGALPLGIHVWALGVLVNRDAKEGVGRKGGELLPDH